MDSTDGAGDVSSEAAWVSVGAAAKAASVGPDTVRGWYRAGRIPTQRSGGAKGRVLVPLAAVLALAEGDGEVAAELTAEVIDLNASYWSAETHAARAELAAVENQLVFLRSQLAEALEAERVASARIADLEAENAALRASLEGSATSSLRYESPVRPQGGAAASTSRSPLTDAGERAVADVADVPDDAGVAEEPQAAAPHPAPGEHEDDYLPSRERGRRRHRR